jgi:regulator of sigma E protease
MNVFQYGQWIVAALVMIGVLVVIHELGHYLLARLFGIGTPVFSIGMGPRIYGFNRWDTDFRISALPIGGYVQMSGADPFGEEDARDWCPDDKNFMRKPVWQRLLVMVAGPGMNLMLPVVLYTAAFMLGRPASTSTVGTVLPESAAAAAGVQIGDRVVAVGDRETQLMVDVERSLREHVGKPVRLTLTRDGRPVTAELPADGVILGLDGRVDLASTGVLAERRAPVIAVTDPASPAGRAGLRTFDYVAAVDGREVTTWDALAAALTPDVPHTVERVRMTGTTEDRTKVVLTPDATWANPQWASFADAWGLEFPATYVGSVEPESAAARAGVTVGDRIIGIDGEPVQVWRDVLVMVSRTLEGGTIRPLTLEVVRGTEPVKITLEPQLTTDIRGAEVVKRPIMGVKQDLGLFTAGELTTKRYGFVEAIGVAATVTVEQARDILKMLGNIFSGRIGFTRVMGGPVSIVYQAGAAAEGGFFPYVTTMAFLSLSLGVINLLPVPLLDGGQIVFFLLEWIRGRPVPPAIRDRIQMVGALALAALFLVVTISDVSKLFPG